MTHTAIWFLAKMSRNSMGKGKPFQETMLEQLDIHMGKTEPEPLPPYTKINLRCVTDIKTKAEMIPLP